MSTEAVSMAEEIVPYLQNRLYMQSRRSEKAYIQESTWEGLSAGRALNGQNMAGISQEETRCES